LAIRATPAKNDNATHQQSFRDRDEDEATDNKSLSIQQPSMCIVKFTKYWSEKCNRASHLSFPRVCELMASFATPVLAFPA